MGVLIGIVSLDRNQPAPLSVEMWSEKVLKSIKLRAQSSHVHGSHLVSERRFTNTHGSDMCNAVRFVTGEILINCK